VNKRVLCIPCDSFRSMRIPLIPLTLVAIAACAAVAPVPSALAPALPSTGDSSCVAALDSLQAIFRRDYPGYRDKVQGHSEALSALTDSVRTIARTSDHHSVCIPALRRWAQFFRDPHVVGPWQAAPPQPVSSVSPAASGGGAPDDDPGQPSLRFADESTAVLRLPDLEWQYKPVIDSLIAAHRAELLATAYLVVDVRGNGGGCACSYASLTPMLYTNPIHLDGADVWTSASNTALYRSWLAADGVPKDLKAQVRSVLPLMEARPNQFVVWARDTVIRLDTVYALPMRVAVLVDGKCASSCEDFVLEARQSRKVTVMGIENTAGVGDYGNVHGVWLPGWRRVQVPTTRSHRLPDHPIDLVGIAPGVRVPPSDSDAVEFARRYLRSSHESR
jgi:peptidase S41-like protein